MLSIKLVPRQWGFEQQDLGTHGLCVQWYRWSVVYSTQYSAAVDRRRASGNKSITVLALN